MVLMSTSWSTLLFLRYQKPAAAATVAAPAAALPLPLAGSGSFPSKERSDDAIDCLIDTSICVLIAQAWISSSASQG